MRIKSSYELSTLYKENPWYLCFIPLFIWLFCSILFGGQSLGTCKINVTLLFCWVKECQLLINRDKHLACVFKLFISATLVVRNFISKVKHFTKMFVSSLGEITPESKTILYLLKYNVLFFLNTFKNKFNRDWIIHSPLPLFFPVKLTFLMKNSWNWKTWRNLECLYRF